MATISGGSSISLDRGVRAWTAPLSLSKTIPIYSGVEATRPSTPAWSPIQLRILMRLGNGFGLWQKHNTLPPISGIRHYLGYAFAAIPVTVWRDTRKILPLAGFDANKPDDKEEVSKIPSSSATFKNR